MTARKRAAAAADGAASGPARPVELGEDVDPGTTEAAEPGSDPAPVPTGEPDAPGEPGAPDELVEPEALELPPPSAGEVALAAAERLGIGPSPDLRADDPWSEAGRKVLRFHLVRMLSHAPAVVATGDPEEVHAMRVAARRMRAAWRVFGNGFEREDRARYLGELRQLGSRLGTVRDLDVQLGILASRSQRRGARGREALEPLLAGALLEREARCGELAKVLSGDAFAAFVADYEAFVATPGLAARELPPTAPSQVRHRMPAEIWSAYQAVWAFDPLIATADLATLHRLRIAAKWLRYTLEFVRGPLDPDATKLIRPVVALQDRLGDQHDVHGAAELARAGLAAAQRTKPQARAIGKLIADLDGDVVRLGRGIDRTWRPLADPRYRRALGAAIARL